jgi:carbon starvation protein
LVPLIFLLAMTTWALFLQLGEFFQGGDYLLTVVDAIIFVLALWLIIEAIVAFLRVRGERAAGGRSGEG